jgi:cyclopropane-fatty-acyl-phospholipid synthase
LSTTDREQTLAVTSHRSIMARILLSELSQTQEGLIHFTDPDGQAYEFGQPNAELKADLHILDWRAASLMIRQGDVGFALALSRGWLKTPDMRNLFLIALRNENHVDTVHGRWWPLLLKRLVHWVLRDNSRRGSRKNIISHYDLGNQFYELWLDPSMSYSSAWFGRADQRPDHEAAISTDALSLGQQAKYDYIIDTLQAKKGDRVLEIGCGWGGFAQRAAERGLHVYGVTISDAQLNWAQDRISKAGLGQQVELVRQDYRDIQGQFDHIVSIEMFEAVGMRHWQTYFDTLKNCLKPGGRAVLQVIDMADQFFDHYKSHTDFIQQFIFPGGMLPSPSQMLQGAAKAGLHVESSISFGFDYARTLRTWLERFDAQIIAIRAQGFSESFVQLWRMYLVYCEVAFLESRTDVKQWTLSRPLQS